MNSSTATKPFLDKIRHIFFDLDHTLWDTNRNSEESLREIYSEQNIARFGIESFDAFHSVYQKHNERLWGLYAENKVGRDSVRLNRFTHTFMEFGIHDLEPAEILANEFVKRTPSKKHLIAGVQTMLEKLSSRYPLYIITNGFKESQHIKLNSSGIAHYFKEVIISEEVGAHKPDPIIFRYAEKITGNAEPEQCLMIGDTLSTDVMGACHAGWHALHFSPQKDLDENEHPTLRSWPELEKWL